MKIADGFAEASQERMVGAMKAQEKLTLYWGSGSPVSWRTLLTLCLKKCGFESRRLDLGEKEHRSDWFRAINPRGTFPVLVDGEVTLRGSMAQMHYLDSVFPEPPLFGDNAVEAGLIHQCLSDQADLIEPSVEDLTRCFFRKGSDRSEERVLAIAESVKAGLLFIEETCAFGPYLLGSKLSAADIVLYPTIGRLLRVLDKHEHPSLTKVLGVELAVAPRLGEWRINMQSLDGVEDTHPPHWKDS